MPEIVLLDKDIERYENLLKTDLSCEQRGAIKRHLFRLKLANLDSQLKMPFEKKVEYSLELIKKAVKDHKKYCVACSFGKDSTVLVHLVRKIDYDVVVLFSNTGVEYPETLKFRDLLIKKWDFNYVEVKPEKNFWQCVKEYGYPTIRYYSLAPGRKKNKKTSGVPKCCYYLKEKPAYNYYKENGIDLIFVGITAEESYQRRWTIIRYGDYFYSKKKKVWRSYPLAFWKVEDIWRYTHENNLPISEVYRFTDRNGCIPCTGYISWRKNMSKLHPKMYRKIMKDMIGSNLDDFQ